MNFVVRRPALGSGAYSHRPKVHKHCLAFVGKRPKATFGLNETQRQELDLDCLEVLIVNEWRGTRFSRLGENTLLDTSLHEIDARFLEKVWRS
jgi:hypothetical protein